MSCSLTFYAFLLGIFTVISLIRLTGGDCSIQKKQACELTGSSCSNNKCTPPCYDGFVEVNGQCYDSIYAQDIVLEHLENCDPNVDSDCKRSLEAIRDQLGIGLSESSNANGLDTGLPKSTKPPTSGGNEHVVPIKEYKQKKRTKLDYLLSKEDHEADSSEGSHSVEELSKETDDRGRTSALSKKRPVHDEGEDSEEIPDVYFVVIIIACTLSGVAGIALSGYCWYKLHNNDENKSDYIPGVKKSNGKTTPTKNGDRKLDYKAEMYHYVHTKNQIAAMEKAKSDLLGSGGLSNDEEDEVEDYTVYECPGLASTGDMMVVNPLFSDQEVTGSDEGRTHSNHSSPSTPARSIISSNSK